MEKKTANKVKKTVIITTLIYFKGGHIYIRE